MPLANRYTQLKTSLGMAILLILLSASGAVSASLSFNSSGFVLGSIWIFALAITASIICQAIWADFLTTVHSFASSILGGLWGWVIAQFAASMFNATDLVTTVLTIAVGAISTIAYFFLWRSTNRVQ